MINFDPLLVEGNWGGQIYCNVSAYLPQLLRTGENHEHHHINKMLLCSKEKASQPLDK